MEAHIGATALELLGVALMLALVAHVAAHVALVVALGRASPRRAAVAFFLPPAGALWAWEAGLRRHVLAYGATLGAFAALVVATAIAR